MMGSEEEDAQQARLYTSTDAMESLVLEDHPHSYLSTSDYRSAMAGGSSALQESHPLAPKPEQNSFKDSYRQGFQDSARSNSFRDTMIEPPSYADAIFSPYMDKSANGSTRDLGNKPSSSFSSSPSSSEVLMVRVTDPQKVQETGASLVPGGSSYVTYRIITHTNLSSYQGSDFSVRRRFRDVVTLADRLAENYRGYLIPPRPDKSVVESQVMQKVEFIEQRRAALEKYLGRLATHPVLCHSDQLRKFLQSEEKKPLQPTTDMASRMLDGAVNLPRQLFGEGSGMITPQEAVQPAKGGRDLLRMFKELKQSVTNDWSNAKPAIMEEDKEFMEKKERLHDLEHQLSYASQQAEALVKAQQEVGEVMGELGLAFVKLAKFENKNAAFPSQRAFASASQRIATGAIKASRLHRESNAFSVKHLDELHEYLGLMQALHAAFADRNNALLTVQTLMTDVAASNSRIDKLVISSNKIFGGNKAQNRKIDELKETVKVTEEARNLALKEYDQIKEHNKEELERFDEKRQRDFMNMLRGFVQTQVGYSKNIANVWTKVADEASGLNRSSDASSSGFSTPN